MSKRKIVQKKAPKKRKSVFKYPREVATKKYHRPMSDADFIASIATWSGEGAGESFRDTMIEMLDSAFEGRISKKQYRMLESAMKKYAGFRISRPVNKADRSYLEEMPFLE